MKTASDILLTEIKNYQNSVEIYGFESAFDNDEIIQAQALAEAERKVLEVVEPICKQLMLANTPITQESAEFIQAYIELYKLRGEMGL